MQELPSGTVTFLFTDIEGSSRLWEQHPEAMRRAVSEHNQLLRHSIESHHGAVFKTVGDGFCAVFADAAEAVTAAVSLQQTLQSQAWPTSGPVRVWVALNTGAAELQEGDYLGPSLNRISRLLNAGHGGQVLLSQATADRVQEALPAGASLRALGSHRLRDLQRPEQIFQLLHPALPADFPPLRSLEAVAQNLPAQWTSFVGREAELAVLKRRVDAALQGAGGTVLLAGEPGIGKTRLATEASVYARLRGFKVLTGRCAEEGAIPYQPFVEALLEYLSATESRQVEQMMPPPVACELVRIVPQIAAKVRDVPQLPPLPAEQARHALAEAARQFFATFTAGTPLLLFLDDLHWADEGSLALLHALARHALGMRLLIAGTYRDVELDTQHPLERTLLTLNRERLAHRLTLRRLPEPAVAQMVAAILDEPGGGLATEDTEGTEEDGATSETGRRGESAYRSPHPVAPSPSVAPSSSVPSVSSVANPSAFVAALYHETEGNPFYVEEVLKHLVEERAIYREENRWEIKPLEQFSVPQSIKVTIGRRLQRLSEASREALTLAAVIGDPFRFEVLWKASAQDEDALLEMVEEWLAAHLVVEQRQGREDLYRFHHAQIRAVLYDALSLRRKARLHERVGAALEEVYADNLQERLDALAYHFSQAQSERSAEKAIDYCLGAAEKALRLNANEGAIRHLTAAQELLDGLPEDEAHLRRRWDVVERRARAYLNRQEYEPARALVRDYLSRAEAAGYLWGQAAAHGWLGHWHRNPVPRLQHFETSLALCEQHYITDELLAETRLNFAQSLVFRPEPDLARAEPLLRRTLETPAQFPVPVVRATYGTLMDVAAQQGKWDEVAAAFEQSLPTGGPGEMVLCFCLSAMEKGRVETGQWPAFVAFCERAKQLLAEAGIEITLNQWFLEPGQPSRQFGRVLFEDHFDGPELHARWEWHAPLPESAYTLSERPGYLVLRAPVGADLFPPFNLNAPRMLLEVRSDFALEVRMEGDWDERLGGTSGLLIWKDVLNYVRLDKVSMTSRHNADLMLEARVKGEFRHFGRGWSRGDDYTLRLERTGERVVGLCSTDGETWFRCGDVAFPAGDPLLVGVHAIGGMVVAYDWVRVLGREGR